MTYPAATRLRDAEGRRIRGRRICRIVEAYSDLRIADCRVLDIGASHLLIAMEIADAGAQVVGIDVDEQALVQGMAHAQGRLLGAIAASAEALPFQDGSFDLVICNHVYEHVRNQQLLISEIRRVLSPTGLCYFAGGHKYQLMEPHYRIPFLSWVPVHWADRLLKRLGMSGYDISFLDLQELHSLVEGFRKKKNLTPDLLANASRFEIAPRWIEKVFSALPAGLRTLLSRLAPTQIWLLGP